MTKEERKVNKLLIKVKYNAYKLKESGQLPTFLFTKVVQLGVNTPMDQVRVYMSLCDLYMRRNGFYKQYPEYNKIYEDEIKEFLKERGLI